jgi:hypothetical protein
MQHDPVGCYLGHERVAVMHALSPAELKGERDGVGKIARIGRRELVIVGQRHDRRSERTKQKTPLFT